jgi:SAM-dependent methyltransferase
MARKGILLHREDERYLRFLIPECARVLEIGCGTGDTLAALKPSYGVGVDFSPGMIEQARRLHPELEFQVGDAEDPETISALKGPFDFILVQDTIGSLDDCQAFLAQLHPLCAATRALSSDISPISGSLFCASRKQWAGACHIRAECSFAR